MNKSDTIALIQQLNTKASAAFLAGFSNDDLQAYLDRLTSPRTRPVMTRTPFDADGAGLDLGSRTVAAA